MTIDPSTGVPYGPGALDRFRKGPPMPWWGPIVGGLFFLFAWAVFTIVRELLRLALDRLVPVAVWPLAVAALSAGTVIVGGALVVHLRKRRPRFAGSVEIAVGTLAAVYLSLSSPELGLSTAMSFTGSVFGVADGLARVRRDA